MFRISCGAETDGCGYPVDDLLKKQIGPNGRRPEPNLTKPNDEAPRFFSGENSDCDSGDRGSKPQPLC
jgi:hypothetical protein